MSQARRPNPHSTFRQLTVNASSKISSKVTHVTSELFSERGIESSIVVEVNANGSAANKLITIVEIVKREAAKRLAEIDKASHSNNPKTLKPEKLWQYSRLRGEDKFSTSVSHTVKGSAAKNDATKTATTALAPANRPDTMVETLINVPKSSSGSAFCKKRTIDELSDHEDTFEMLQPATKRLCKAAALEISETPKTIPVLSIRLSLTRMDVLKSQGWGEQCVP